MDQETGPALLAHFAALRDPRKAAKVLYPLPEIMLLLLCATLAGADDFVEISLWGREQLPFLRKFLPFANGIPSHDTLSPGAPRHRSRTVQSLLHLMGGDLRQSDPDLIAVDGKTSRRTHARSNGREPLHLVSALGNTATAGAGPTSGCRQIQRNHHHSAAVATA